MARSGHTDWGAGPPSAGRVLGGSWAGGDPVADHSPTSRRPESPQKL